MAIGFGRGKEGGGGDWDEGGGIRGARRISGEGWIARGGDGGTEEVGGEEEPWQGRQEEFALHSFRDPSSGGSVVTGEDCGSAGAHTRSSD